MSDEANDDVQAAVDAALAKSKLDWCGVSVMAPAKVEDLDPDVIEAFENGKAITAIRAIFGSGEYERARDEFDRLHGHRPTMGEMNQLADAIVNHFGFESSGE